MSHIIAVLQEIRRRPGMYIGWPSLSRLSGFLHGYDIAFFKLQAATGDPFFISFQEWFHRRLQGHHDFWENILLQQTGSEAAAFERFWDLFDEYIADQGSGEQQINGAISPTRSLTKEP